MKAASDELPPLDQAGRILLERLNTLRLGPADSSLPFERRLARENNWSDAYAARVCHEYRRFVFLCHHTGRPLTPSDAVDQAWHLHLCYSRSYWHRMCREVLGRPLHHEPTRGGEAEAAKFVDWYDATHQAYEAIFGEPAPSDIWPPSQARFASAAAFRRVNTAEHWVISRAAVRRVARVCLLALLLTTLPGCVFSGELLGFFALLVGSALFLIVVTNSRKRGQGRRNDSGGGYGGCGGCGGDAGCGGGGCGGGCGS